VGTKTRKGSTGKGNRGGRRKVPEKTLEEIKREEYLTVAEAARYARFTKPQIYEMVKTGLIPATRVPGKPHTIRIQRTDLEAFMERNKIKPQDED